MTYKNKIATVALSTLIAATALSGAASAQKDKAFSFKYELANLTSQSAMVEFEERLKMAARKHCRSIPAIGVERAERQCEAQLISGVMDQMQAKRRVYLARND